ncbi:MAG: radical SAM protein [Desulfurivibrionaceae bacterium]|nr:radical SAM protein [Desulfurivibrionaceae bacterium]
MKTPPRLEVSELFFSIQGESSYAGQPCVFIRLSGCNLRCRYCDAGYTYEEPGTLRDIGEILSFAGQYPGFPVEITGGEPLLQDNVYPLMDELLKAGREVLLETNGSINLARVPAGVVKIMDAKCPGSNMHEHLKKENLGLLGPGDELKFVLCSRADYDWAAALIRKTPLNKSVIIHFSPVPGELDPARLAEWLLEDRLPVRLQLQLHKIIWPGIDRGK